MIERDDLLRRIEAFDIDGGEAALPFAARLAREQGWTRSYAERVVREYKRFVFLAMTNTEPCCPSEDVDSAWHLHLTYTRSYWKRFCGDLLGRPLHHEPTRGSPTEAQKHAAMYESTLAAYRQAFGESPPSDVWPPTAQRFGEDLRHRSVNTAQNWILPKRPIRRAAQLVAVTTAATLLVPGCNGDLNPFALKGSEFFWFFIPAMVGSLLLGQFLKQRVSQPEVDPGNEGRELRWDEAAYLNGSAPRLTTAVFTRLAQRGLIEVADDRLVRAGDPAADVSPLEHEVLRHLPIKKDDLRSINRTVETWYAADAQRLEHAGYRTSLEQRIWARLMAFLPPAVVLFGFGVTRFVLGTTAGKPSGFLAIALIFGFILLLTVTFGGNLNVSRRGRYLLDTMRERTSSTAADHALVVALFGTLALQSTALAYLNDWYPKSAVAGSSGGCATGCGAGGGGCGGGGCGGGGCGGCGGGD